MKKAIALISILAALTVPVLANTSTTGLGIHLGQSFGYSLDENVKNSNARSFDVTFNTAGGTTFYVHNEFGDFNIRDGQGGNVVEHVQGTETVHGVGVLANVAKTNVKLNVLIGSATTEIAAGQGAANIAGGAAYSSTNPIADLGAGYHVNFGNAKLAMDIAYRHHLLKDNIDLRNNERLNNKSGIRFSATVGYGF
ncbi:hypothetical protein DID75_02330 [Candidatus Marinamargulisbacteria bacterium SCGC AG-410-N11]|nr:hypothetical protein DID75_02330 [Candidatus Marinamargulisbacteria bacterium SCGC AG-410-N11]